MGYVPPQASALIGPPKRFRALFIGGHLDCCVRTIETTPGQARRLTLWSRTPSGYTRETYFLQRYFLEGEEVRIFLTTPQINDDANRIVAAIAAEAFNVPDDFHNRFWIGLALQGLGRLFEEQLDALATAWHLQQRLKRVAEINVGSFLKP